MGLQAAIHGSHQARRGRAKGIPLATSPDRHRSWMYIAVVRYSPPIGCHHRRYWFKAEALSRLARAQALGTGKIVHFSDEVAPLR